MQYSIVNLKTVKENSDFRIDAEYFHPSKLNSLRILKNNPFIFLGDYVLSIKRNETPKDSNIEIYDTGAASSHILTKNLAQTEERTSLKRRAKGGDIIISRLRPYLKQVAYIPTFIDKAYLTTEFFVLRSKDKENISFLTPFLLTEFVQEILFWGQGGTQHPRFQEYDLLNLPLTKNIFGLKEILNKIVSKCCKLVLESDHLYSQAEQLLLSELGLLDWKPKHTLAFVKNYSDTQKAERIDAEYFQPFYDEIENQLSKFEQTRLDNICDLINYGTVPTSPYVEKGKAYIKGLNLVDGFIVGPFDYLENTENLSEKFYTKENDIIISQMGTVGKAGLVSKEEEGFLFASFTIRARLKNDDFIKPHVLTMFINTIARPYYLLRKIAQASVRQNTDLPTIKALKVPKLDKRLQENIQKKVIKSQKAKKLSKSLLEIAKRGVEIAIEKDEQEAEEWIESEIEKLGVRIQ
jgi:hypothetical protein